MTYSRIARGVSQFLGGQERIRTVAALCEERPQRVMRGYAKGWFCDRFCSFAREPNPAQKQLFLGRIGFHAVALWLGGRLVYFVVREVQ